jgi:hypothetical protein
MLAAGAGILMRFGLLTGLPFGLLHGDVRHAHSHLMFFGWITPVLMLLLLNLQQKPLGTAARSILVLTLLAALSSFLPFLLSGYRFTSVAGHALPLSMITSGLNGVAWYAFSVLYLLRMRGVRLTPVNRYFLVALGLLFISSLGAVALAGVGMLKGGPVLTASLATFFLDLFAEGWFGVALLGIAHARRPAAARQPAVRAGLLLLGIGLPLRSLAELLLANGLTVFAPLVATGSLLAGLGLLASLGPLWRELLLQKLSLWHVSLGLLAVKGVVDVALSGPGFAAWSDAAGLRVFYLHAYLLGAVTLGLVQAVREQLGSVAFRAPWLLAAAVLLLIASLLPLTGAWPAALAGSWAPVAAAWLSAAPLLAVLAGK